MNFKNLLLEVKRYYTGSKSSSIFRIILTLFLLLIGSIFGYYFHNFLDDLNAEPKIYFENLQPYLEEDLNGIYLPIYYSNIGDKEIENTNIKVKTCHMTEHNYYDIGDFAESSGKQILKFYDKETIELLKSKDCSIRETNSSGCPVNIHNYNNTLFAPKQNCTIYQCNLCDYNISIEGENFNESFSGEFLSPYKYIFEVASFKDLDNNEYLFSEKEVNLSTYHDGIIWNMFDENQVCNWNFRGNCDYKNGFLNWKYVFSIKLPPKNKSLSNAEIYFKPKYPNDIDVLKKLDLD